MCYCMISFIVKHLGYFCGKALYNLYNNNRNKKNNKNKNKNNVQHIEKGIELKM